MTAVLAWLRSYLAFVVTNPINVAVTVAIALAIGFGSGWQTKGKFFTAKQAVEIKEVMVQDTKALNEARDKGAKLAKEKAALERENANLRDKLAGAIPPTPSNTQPEDTTNACPDLSRHIRLSNYAVGLLNRAITGSSPDPEGWSDAEKQALAAAGLRELSDKLTEVLKEHHELAKNHDALVDDVADFQKKQQANRARR